MSTSDSLIPMKRKLSEEVTDLEFIQSEEGESDSDFGTNLLRVTVSDGKTSRHFHVHRHLICSKSPYFAALKNFNEGQKSHVTLKDMDHGAFRQILNWVYSGNFRKDKYHDERTLIMTFVAADRLMMKKCKNMATDELRAEVKNTTMGISSVCLVDELDLPVKSSIVQYILDQYLYDCIETELREPRRLLLKALEFREDMTKEFLYKLYELAREWRECSERTGDVPVNPATLTGCEYHSHGSSKE